MFDIFKTVDLSFLGEEWKDCYLKFSSLSLSEVGKLTSIKQSTDPLQVSNITIGLLESKFIEGKAVKGGVVVDVQKEDLKELPIDIVNKILESFAEGLDKKKLKQSTTASEASEEPSPPTS